MLPSALGTTIAAFLGHHSSREVGSFVALPSQRGQLTSRDPTDLYAEAQSSILHTVSAGALSAVACSAGAIAALAGLATVRPHQLRASFVLSRCAEGEASKDAAAAPEEGQAEEPAKAEAVPEGESTAEPEGPAEEGTDSQADEGDADGEDEDEKEEMAESDEKADEPSAKAKPSKWMCGECNATNFASSTECHKCGAQKPSPAEMELLAQRIAAKDEVGAVMDSFLRLQADLQNYRRQHTESMSRAKDLGKQDALRKLVPFTSEIEKALVPPEGMTDREQSIFESYTLLFKKIQGVWDKLNVERQVVELGTKFDPVKHRKASEREPANEDETPGTIVEVVEEGWNFEGQVLVPSEVAIVAFPKEDETPDDAADDAADEAAEEPEDSAAEGEDDAPAEDASVKENVDA